MTLPIELPVSPMLAKAVDAVPRADSIAGGWAYEPKWDGFRCIIVRDGDHIALDSRSKKPLTGYFPELVAAVHDWAPERSILDAEVFVRAGQAGAEHLDWEALSQRIHPAQSRITKLSQQTPAELVCFDLLALDDEDWTPRSYDERRARLVELFETQPTHRALHLTRHTYDDQLAQQWFVNFEGAGLDGVVAKARQDRYRPGERTMLKIKHKRTADAVVIGYRKHRSGHGVGSLLLGMYDESGNLLPVGGIGAFSNEMRAALYSQLQELVITDADGQPVTLDKKPSRYANLRDDSAIALRPEIVAEVKFDQLEGLRFRHAATLARFRPDRDPESCLIEQVDRPAKYDLAEVLEAH